MLEEFHDVLFLLFSVPIPFDDSCQSTEFSAHLDPDVPSDEGYVTAKALIDGLLDVDSGPGGIKKFFLFCDINQAHDDSSTGIQNQFTVVDIIPNGKGQVVKVHLEQKESFVLWRTEHFRFEWSNVAQLLVVNIFIMPQWSFLELLGIRKQPEDLLEGHALGNL